MAWTTLGGDNTLSTSAEVHRDNTNQLEDWADALNAAGVIHAGTYGVAAANTAAANTTGLQDALDDLNGGSGGTVVLPAGTILLNGVTGYSNIAIVGQGRGATILKLADSADKDVLRFKGAQGALLDSITIRDLSIDGNKANQTTPYTNGYGDNGLFLAGVRLYYVREALVDNVHVFGCGGYGVEIKSSEDVSVANCWAENCADDGFSVADRGNLAESTRISFVNCWAFDMPNDAGGGSGNGFEVDDGPTHVVFTNCQATNNFGGGFSLHSHAGQQDPAHIKYLNCVADNNTGNQFVVSDAQVSIDNVTFLGCTATGGTGGWNIDGATNLIMQACTRIEGTGEGIVITDTTQAIVNACIVKSPGTQGIRVGGTSADVRLTNNLIERAGDDASAVGIRISSSATDTHIVGNRIADGGSANMTWNIQVLAGAVDTVIVNNDVTDAGSSGTITDSGTGTLQVFPGAAGSSHNWT